MVDTINLSYLVCDIRYIYLLYFSFSHLPLPKVSISLFMTGLLPPLKYAVVFTEVNVIDRAFIEGAAGDTG